MARPGTGLFPGLGAIALLVGALGIANIMVIAVLERRAEIGLRRAHGARHRHIAAQFLAESVLLAVLGGGPGLALGTAVTAIVARTRCRNPTVSPLALWVGLAGG